MFQDETKNGHSNGVDRQSSEHNEDDEISSAAFLGSLSQDQVTRNAITLLSCPQSLNLPQFLFWCRTLFLNFFSSKQCGAPSWFNRYKN